MDFFSIGDEINVKDYNSLVYLLRKFKRLNTVLRLGSLSLESDYGSFVFDKPLTSVGGNFIIEQEVNVSSNDCLKNCFYSFVFNVIDVNTSGTVNKRQVKVTGGTGDDGVLFVTLPTDLIESDEVILPSFELDIVFDEHEYYTPVASIIKVSLTVDKPVVVEGETATVTAVLLDEDNDPLVEVPCNFFVNGVMFTETTDSDGVAVYEYTGTGSDSTVTVRVIDKTVRFEDKSMSVVTAVFTEGSIFLGETYHESWLVSNGDVVIDWGDGTSDTVNNPTRPLSHTYTDGLSEHTITFIGEITRLGFACFRECTGLTSIEIPDSVTSLGDDCFYECSGLTSIVIPDSVTSLGEYCFSNCTGLTSIEIPDSVTSLGDYCFSDCTGLTSITLPNSVTSLGSFCFARCTGLTSIDIPSNVVSLGTNCFRDCTNLVDFELYWRDTQIIPYTSNLYSETGNAVFTVPYGQKNNYTAKNYPVSKVVERASGKKLTTLSIQSSKASYYTDETITLTGTLIDEDNLPLESASVKLYQNNVLLDTLTTDSNGEYEKTLTGLSVGAYTFKAVYDGDNTYEASTSSNLNITVKNHTYSLSIASDKQSILTTESVTISGTLLKDSTAFSGQSVVLYDGASVVDTLSTDGSGNYSKTITGLSVGVHTFKAVHTNAESSTISITVNEPTHTYSLSIASDKSSILTTESVTISGQLLMDSSPYASQSVALYDGATLVATLTTDGTGEYEETVSGLSVGVHTFKAVHSNVESSTISITVNEPTPVHDYSLSVASSKDILSYADSESATITGTLTDGGVAVAGETLSYVIKHGSTTISTGSDTTDSNGQISFSYASTGIGDVTIEVDYGILLQETYALQDLWYYNPNTYSTSSTQLNITLPSTPFTLEYTLKQGATGSSVPYLDIGNASNNRMLIGQYARAGGNGLIIYKSSSTTHAYSTNPTTNQDNIVWFKADGSKYYYKLNDGVVMEVADAGITLSKIIHIEAGASSSNYIKNIKVKAL